MSGEYAGGLRALQHLVLRRHAVGCDLSPCSCGNNDAVADISELVDEVKHWKALAMSTHGELAKENEKLREELQIMRNRVVQNEKMLK